MKALLMVLAMFFSLSAMAEVPYIVAREMTCEEVKLTIENYGKVKLKTHFLGLPSTGHLYREVVCPEFSRPARPKFSTKDIRNCRAGFKCAGSGGKTRRPLNHRN